jgi:hypothetical protein
MRALWRKDGKRRGVGRTCKESERVGRKQLAAVCVCASVCVGCIRAYDLAAGSTDTKPREAHTLGRSTYEQM